ncbi:MAG TPA: condensin subunit MukF [Polyangiaceae bacterium]|nr:condensin subunit MukF [Polyangiaceae bacterium]
MVHDSSTPSPEQTLAAFIQKRPSLELSTLDLCFVVTLQLQAQEHALPSFREEQLVDAFERVCAIVAPGTELVAARATHTIRRLRDQRLLTRVDGAGVSRAGEFALSRLAGAIVDFFIEDEVLTRDSLDLLARTLLVSLSEVLERARRAKRPQDWQAGVVGPLRITASDLILGVERRQRGLDVQQEQFQREIGGLLETDWFNAIDRCQQLLDETASTLQQLNELLLRYTHQIETLLEDILELASRAEARTAEAVTQRVMGQIDRVAAWGAARQEAWSEYYDYVHRYLRDVVRLDPARALTQRLREQLSGHVASPFSLTVAHSPPLTVLRSVVPPAPPAPVRRPRAERTPKVELVASENPMEALARRVRGVLDEGAADLSQVTARVVEEMPTEQGFATAGKVAELAAQLGRPSLSRERPWVPVRDGLVIEDWHLEPSEGA